MVNIAWISWQRSTVEGIKCSCKFRNSLHALIPILWGMLVYKEVTSCVTGKVPGSSNGNHLSLFIKSVVSCMSTEDTRGQMDQGPRQCTILQAACGHFPYVNCK